MPTSLSEVKVLGLFRTTKCNELFLAMWKGKKVILKKIDKAKTTANFIENEIKAGTVIKHTNVVKLYGHFEDSTHEYLILEYIDGIDLYDVLESQGFRPIQEKFVKNLFRQLLNTVEWLHHNGVTHRDLKLENIILLNNRKKIKLIDFGLCEIGKHCKAESNDWCGSPDYVSPEILDRKTYILCKCDVWSLGIVLFTMLFAELPFGLEDRVRAITNGERHPTLVFPSRLKDSVSDEAKDLIEKLLAIDPSKRPFLEDIKTHLWFKRQSLCC